MPILIIFICTFADNATDNNAHKWQKNPNVHRVLIFSEKSHRRCAYGIFRLLYIADID